MDRVTCSQCGSGVHLKPGMLAALEPLWWHDVPALDLDHDAHA